MSTTELNKSDFNRLQYFRRVCCWCGHHTVEAGLVQLAAETPVSRTTHLAAIYPLLPRHLGNQLLRHDFSVTHVLSAIALALLASRLPARAASSQQPAILRESVPALPP